MSEEITLVDNSCSRAIPVLVRGIILVTGMLLQTACCVAIFTTAPEDCSLHKLLAGFIDSYLVSEPAVSRSYAHTVSTLIPTTLLNQ
jgi:hypothetical protein